MNKSNITFIFKCVVGGGGNECALKNIFISLTLVNSKHN